MLDEHNDMHYKSQFKVYFEIKFQNFKSFGPFQFLHVFRICTRLNRITSPAK